MASTSYSGELPRVQPEVPRRPISLTANDASTTSPLAQRPQSSTTNNDDAAARMSRGEEASGGFRGRVTSFGSLPSAAGAGGLLRTWSYGGHASLDRAGEGGASMPTELLGTPIARAGYLPDLEPLIMGSRSGAFFGRSFSTPAIASSVNDPRGGGGGGGRGGGACCSPRVHSATMDEPLLTEDEAEGRRGACPALQQGSVWGTAFNMCSATLGAGALALPYAIQHTGTRSSK
jgi:hypothetical protein